MTFNDYSDLEDYKLVELSINRDYRAFELLVTRYYKKITNLLFQYTKDQGLALDLSQEVFLKVYKKLETFDPQYRFKTWLYRIAVNSAVSAHRKKQRRVRSFNAESEILENLIPNTNNNPAFQPEDALLQKESRIKITNCVEQLREEYRNPFILRHFHEMKYDEIADILDIPAGTVKTYIHRARKDFISLWKKTEQDDV